MSRSAGAILLLPIHDSPVEEYEQRRLAERSAAERTVSASVRSWRRSHAFAIAVCLVATCDVFRRVFEVCRSATRILTALRFCDVRRGLRHAIAALAVVVGGIVEIVLVPVLIVGSLIVAVAVAGATAWRTLWRWPNLRPRWRTLGLAPWAMVVVTTTGLVAVALS